MIDRITLKFGPTGKCNPLEIDVSPITVFVGPNNSGKSVVLFEIENHCRGATKNNNNLIINKLDFTPYSEEEIEKEISKIEQSPQPGERINPSNVILGKLNAQNGKGFRTHLNKSTLIREAQNPNQGIGTYATFLSIYTVRLDGTNRLSLLNTQSAGNLKNLPENHLAFLFQNDHLREKVRKIVYEAFKKYFVIDPTNIGQLEVRLSDQEPQNDQEEKSWLQPSVDFHKNAIMISNTGDGVKAFIGIIATILAGDPKIVLIDEPEAFLHPALSSKLAKEISVAMKQSRKRLFASTHSSDFLMGCIQSGSPLNIVRLTYNYNQPTARLLPQEKLIPLMRNPLLRSTGVLEGLFYESVIVTEGDADRAFYQEINERLLAVNDSRGIPSCLFINAQNKQTIWDIVKPLRELGIPAAGIVDIDFLKDGGSVFTKALRAVFVPESSHESLNSLRINIKKKFEALGKNMKTQGGVRLLENPDKETCNRFFEQLQEYGVFVVPGGELESWIPNLGVHCQKPHWLIKVFEEMGENPDDSQYLHPEDGDVWNFMGKVKEWCIDEIRKGIPSEVVIGAETPSPQESPE